MKNVTNLGADKYHHLSSSRTLHHVRNLPGKRKLICTSNNIVPKITTRRLVSISKGNIFHVWRRFIRVET